MSNKIRTSRYRRSYGVLGQRRSDIIDPNASPGGGGCSITGSGFVSCDIYGNSGLLEVSYPAASNSASFGLVLSSSLPVTYQSNGISWLLINSGAGGGSMSLSTQVINSDTTAASNNVLLVDTSGGDITITLPDASTTPSTFYHVKKTDDSFNSVFLDATGAQTIDGETEAVEIDFPQNSFQVVTNGTDSWFII